MFKIGDEITYIFVDGIPTADQVHTITDITSKWIYLDGSVRGDGNGRNPNKFKLISQSLQLNTEGIVDIGMKHIKWF